MIAPDVLPSGQCIKKCTEKEDADVTDQCKQIVALCESMINCLLIEDCKLVVTV